MPTKKFEPTGDKALARKPLFIKVSEETLAVIERELPYGDRSTWLRRVVTEAVDSELIEKKAESSL